MKLVSSKDDMQRMTALYEKFLTWAEDGRISPDFLIAADSSYPNKLDNHIATLFGYRDANDMAYNYRIDENRHLAQLLLSSNGWTIYKMLLARMDGCVNTTG